MTTTCGLLALEALLAQSRQLVVASRKAVASSRAAIAASSTRSASTETLRSTCLPAASLPDMQAANLVERMKSALDQAAIDREVRSTTTEYAGFDSEVPPGYGKPDAAS